MVSTKSYLDDLMNRFGDFKVSALRRENGVEVGDKTWRSYFSVRDKDWYVETIKHRTILKPEIVLDLEEKELYEPAIKRLDEEHRRYRAFSTGSKGYHIHLIFPELADMDDYKVKVIKEIFIKRFKGDIQKAGTCMIALEFVEHWKGTGRCKELLIEKEGYNSLGELKNVRP